MLGNWIATCERMKLNHYFIPHKKINSKLINTWNIRPNTIQLLEGNIGNKLLSNDFLGYDARSKGNKSKK